MPRLARSSARCGPTPLIMRTSVVRERGIDASFIPLGESRLGDCARFAGATAFITVRREATLALGGWLTIIPTLPPSLCMCGRERTCGGASLYVWQPKDLAPWGLRLEDASEPRVPTPPRVFCEKRLQVLENKGKQCEKERQEISRGGNLLRIRYLRAAAGRGTERIEKEAADMARRRGSSGREH